MLGVCILIILHIELALGCFGGGGGGGGGSYSYSGETSKERKFKQEAISKIGKDAFGGFEIPKDVAQKWIDFWIRNRLLENADKDRNLTDQEKLEDGRSPDMGWPYAWNGLQVGDSGVREIPPWAWVPVNDQSLPTYCFLNVDAGTEKGYATEQCSRQARYAYNAYLKNCLPFEYLGCGGNTNNFVLIEDCVKLCMPHPKQGGCDPDVIQLMSTLSDLDDDWGEGGGD